MYCNKNGSIQVFALLPPPFVTNGLNSSIQSYHVTGYDLPSNKLLILILNITNTSFLTYICIQQPTSLKDQQIFNVFSCAFKILLSLSVVECRYTCKSHMDGKKSSITSTLERRRRFVDFLVKNTLNKCFIKMCSFPLLHFKEIFWDI